MARRDRLNDITPEIHQVFCVVTRDGTNRTFTQIEAAKRFQLKNFGSHIRAGVIAWPSLKERSTS